MSHKCQNTQNGAAVQSHVLPPLTKNETDSFPKLDQCKCHTAKEVFPIDPYTPYDLLHRPYSNATFPNEGQESTELRLTPRG